MEKTNCELVKDIELKNEDNISFAGVVVKETATGKEGAVLVGTDKVKIFWGNPNGEDDILISFEEFNKNFTVVTK